MAQVKFYSKSALPTGSALNQDGVYFINGGELYKGSQRFGLARVTNDSDPDTNLTSANGAARGDINVYEGTAKVFNGTSWIALTDGALAAKVSAIETVVSVVTSQEQGQEPVTTKTVTADTGYFTNLTVSDTATFSATTVSATTLTVGGSTVNQIAQAEISSKTAASISNPQGTSLVTEGQVIDYVDGRLSTFGNVMHFAGVVDGQTGEGHQQYLPATGTSGDIWVITGSSTITAPETGYAASPATVEPGQEYVWDGTKWEVIGDQNTYATATTVSTLAGRVDTIEATLSTSGTAFSATVFAPTEGQTIASASTSSDLVTASQVYDYVTAEVSNLNLGTAAQADVLILGEGSTIADASQSTDLVTAAQVAAYVDDQRVTELAANVITYSKTDDSTGITSDVTNVSAAIEALDAAVVSLSSSLDTVVSSISDIVAAKASAGTATTTSQTVVFSVTFSSDAAPSMSVTGLGAAASLAVASSIGPSVSVAAQAAQGTEGQEGYVPAVDGVDAASNANLATEKAVRDAIDAAIAAATLEWITDDTP